VIPYDPNGAWYTSGIRVGTPAATTLGMGPGEMREIASIMQSVLTVTEADPSSRARFQLPEQVRDGARKRVADLLAAHPLYPQISL
jgi:glycine hydroxymethyltransferase